MSTAAMGIGLTGSGCGVPRVAAATRQERQDQRRHNRGAGRYAAEKSRRK